MMLRLPLFPLTAVLLPGALLPLHVFEARYRRMVAHCIESDRKFGLLYHDNDSMGPFLFEEDRVGTVAQIEKYHLLAEGRSLILVRGLERFRIRAELESEEPYYEAEVSPFTDRDAENQALLERRKRSMALLETLLSEMPDGPHDIPELDPEHEVSFRLASTIQADPAWQQTLLDSASEAERLESLDRVLAAAIDHCSQE